MWKEMKGQLFENRGAIINKSIRLKWPWFEMKSVEYLSDICSCQYIVLLSYTHVGRSCCSIYYLLTRSCDQPKFNTCSVLQRFFFFLRKQDRDLIYMFPGDVFWGKGNNTNIWEEIAYIYVPEIFFPYLERQSEKKTTNFPLFFILSSTQDHNVKYKQCSNRVMKCWRLSGHLRGSLSGIYILFFKHNTTVCKNKSK